MSHASTTLNPRGLNYTGIYDEEGESLSPSASRAAWIAFGVLMAGLTSAYLNMLAWTSTYWSKDMYSHGWIVPLFAGYLFWLRSRAEITLSRQELYIGGGIVAACAAILWFNSSSGGKLSSTIPVFDSWFPHLLIWLAAAMFVYCMRNVPLLEVSAAERWIGVAVVAACLGLRLWSAYYDYNNPERLSFIGALLGVCLIIGGKSMLRWAGPALAFLIFMFPLPSMVENTLLMRLQTVATILSTWTLQLLGVSAARFGNTISIDTLETPLQVAEACSGLRMLTIFGAMSVAMFLIIDRPWWDRLIILLSAIPIALLSNVIRIVTTALLYMAFGQDNETVNKIIHDWAGFAMMPIGLGLLWIELTILSRLTVPAEDEDFASFGAATG
jgi:exosortase